jgi:hypothetical protein
MMNPSSSGNHRPSTSVVAVAVMVVAVGLSIYAPNALRAQSATITGTVTDEAGSPVQGASITATAYEVENTRGSEFTAASEADGSYRLDVPIPGAGVFVTLSVENPSGAEVEPRYFALEPDEAISQDWTLPGAALDEETAGREEDGDQQSDRSDEDRVPSGTLLAYLPFDGSATEEVRGLDAELVQRGSGQVETMEGRYGNAALFPGGSFILLPLDIDFDTHRQLTVTGWVYLDDRRYSDQSVNEDGGTIFDTGPASDGTPGLHLSNEVIRASAGRNRPTLYRDLPRGEWTHVAAAWDYDARTVRIHVGGADTLVASLDMDPADLAANGRSQSALDHPEDEEKEPRRYVFVGAQTSHGNRPLSYVGLDDFRIYAGTLSPEEVVAIRESETPAETGRIAAIPEEENEEERMAGGDDAGSDEEADGGGDAAGANDRGRLVDWRLSEDFELSEVSGSAGDQARRLADLETAPVTGVTIWEDNNRPCHVSVSSPGNSDEYARLDYPPCNRVPEMPTSVGDRYAVNALQVCHNRRSGRVKGLELGARRIELDQDAGEVVFREPNADTDANNNCNEWKEFVSCPGRRQVASGVFVHADQVRGLGGRVREEIVGLGLICREVVGVYEGS